MEDMAPRVYIQRMEESDDDAFQSLYAGIYIHDHGTCVWAISLRFQNHECRRRPTEMTHLDGRTRWQTESITHSVPIYQYVLWVSYSRPMDSSHHPVPLNFIVVGGSVAGPVFTISLTIIGLIHFPYRFSLSVCPQKSRS